LLVNSVILGGGVSANNKLRHAVSALNSPQLFPQLEIYLPDPTLSTDNSIMIALAGHSRFNEAKSNEDFIKNIRANGNQSL
jgi:tRNA A37 threonylcarbamoyltransferase TsaD